MRSFFVAIVECRRLKRKGGPESRRGAKGVPEWSGVAWGLRYSLAATKTVENQCESNEAVMQMSAAVTTLDPVSRDFYQSAIRYLDKAEIPFLIGGAYSYARHTDLER